MSERKEYKLLTVVYVMADNEDDAVDQLNHSIPHCEYQVVDVERTYNES